MVYVNFEKIKNTFENFNRGIKEKTNLCATGKFKVQLFMNVRHDVFISKINIMYYVEDVGEIRFRDYIYLKEWAKVFSKFSENRKYQTNIYIYEKKKLVDNFSYLINQDKISKSSVMFNITFDNDQAFILINETDFVKEKMSYLEKCGLISLLQAFGQYNGKDYKDFIVKLMSQYDSELVQNE